MDTCLGRYYSKRTLEHKHSRSLLATHKPMRNNLLEFAINAALIQRPEIQSFLVAEDVTFRIVLPCSLPHSCKDIIYKYCVKVNINNVYNLLVTEPALFFDSTLIPINGDPDVISTSNLLILITDLVISFRNKTLLDIAFAMFGDQI